MGSRSCDGRCVGQRLVEALGPILNVVVVDWASLSWLDLLGLLLGHCCSVLEVCFEWSLKREAKAVKD
jgi:hypothetical protein